MLQLHVIHCIESSSVLQYPKDSRTRLNRINKRGLPHEGHIVTSTIGGIGIDPTIIGGGVVNNRGTKDGIIFAESPVTPGIPVVYRTPEERTANPDRLNLDRRHLTVCPILEVTPVLICTLIKARIHYATCCKVEVIFL